MSDELATKHAGSILGHGGIKACAFAVHVLTASGAALAFLALLAAVEKTWPLMFLWLGLALIVDAVDGPIARRIRVVDLLPRWSGETLDLVVDFVTYVFVPAYAVAASGLMPTPVAGLAGIVIVVTGVIYFADQKMKMEGNYFRGFPVLWNVAAFYLLLVRPSAAVSAGAIAALAILTFLPFRFVHPVRVKRLRPVNLVLLAAWAVLALIALARNLSPGPVVTGGLCAIAAFVFAAGFLRPAR